MIRHISTGVVITTPHGRVHRIGDDPDEPPPERRPPGPPRRDEFGTVVGSAAWRTLRALEACETSTAGAIATAIDSDQTTVSSALAKLAKRNLVKRARKLGNGYIWSIIHPKKNGVMPTGE